MGNKTINYRNSGGGGKMQKKHLKDRSYCEKCGRGNYCPKCGEFSLSPREEIEAKKRVLRERKKIYRKHKPSLLKRVGSLIKSWVCTNEN